MTNQFYVVFKRWIWNFYTQFDSKDPLQNGNGLAGAEMLIGLNIEFGCSLVRGCEITVGGTKRAMNALFCAYKMKSGEVIDLRILSFLNFLIFGKFVKF